MAWIFKGAGRALLQISPRETKRGERSAERRILVSTAPCGAVRPWRRALAFRRSTCGVLVSTAGRAFAGYTGRQPAPGRRLIVASRAEPRRRPSAWLRTTPAGAAPNDIGNYPVPSTRGFAGPHLRSQTSDLLRLQDRLQMAALASRVTQHYAFVPINVQGINAYLQNPYV